MKQLQFILIAMISITTISSFHGQNNEPVTIKDGYYVFPAVSRVVMFYQIKGKNISLYRTHAGHYVAFGTYSVNLSDSSLLVQYHKLKASPTFTELEFPKRDTIGFSVNFNQEVSLFGLSFKEPPSDEAYKNMAGLIRRSSTRVKFNKK